MPASWTPRRALTTATAALAVLLGIGTALAVAPTAAWAGPVPTTADRDVRVVVRTTHRSAAAEVISAAQRLGAARTGRIKALKSVSLAVPASALDRLQRTLARRSDVRSVEVVHRRWLTEEPADPRFADQRVYLNAVRATTAWERPAHGSSAVRVAVVDSGIDVAHPDLAPKVVGTYNALTGGTDVRDVVGHGTGVASVAAAATGNGVGIAGAGYDTSLLAVKVADRTGRIYTDDLAAGIVWAVDNGADVLNLSLGGPTVNRLERDAVAYAQRHDVLVVAAAGNEGTRRRQFPAALPGVLAVGATAASGSARASFSSFGSWVDVGAPGREILVAAAGGGYEMVDGTSYSAPLVSGQAALLEGFRPGRSAAQLSAAVVDGANTAKLGFSRGLVDFAASLDLLPPGTAPVIAAPAAGAVVSGPTTVQASSTAARVRLAFADLVQTVPTSGGVAAATFETYGLRGAQVVTATDCSPIDQCSAAPASTAVTVDNPAPTLTSPVAGSAANADTVAAAADAPGGAVRFLVDGSAAATDTSAPYAAELSTERLADGVHTVEAVLCRSDGTVCDTASTSAAVTVQRLHPQITDVSTTALSPRRDGRNDDTRVRYRVDGRQVVTFRVRDASGVVVRSRSLGERGGVGSVTWDGRDGKGRPVRNGDYTVEISTREPQGALVGLATATVTVDKARPRISAVKANRERFYPVRDRYRDKVAVSGSVGEPLASLRLEVRTRGGALVATKRARGGDAGARRIVWNGRVRGGRLASSGTYLLRLVARDVAGNERASRPARVLVSRARLARRTGTMTVSAVGSMRESFADECSLVFRHTGGPRQGWVGYYASGTCSADDAYAVGDHQVRLPSAVRYGTVRISAHGGRADEKFRDSGRLTYIDRFENLSKHSMRLPPRLGTHVGPTVKAKQLLIRNRVLRWSTSTDGTAWYDVDRYTVRYTYFVLR